MASAAAGMTAVVELVEQVAGQRLAVLIVRGATRQDVVVPGEVLHELAWQLNRIPRHAVDARHAGKADARQQVVQHMAELVKQRDDIVMGQQRDTPVIGWLEIADQVADRLCRAAIELLSRDALVDPCAGALAIAGEQVGVETAKRLAVLQYGEVAHILMPG